MTRLSSAPSGIAQAACIPSADAGSRLTPFGVGIILGARLDIIYLW